jgi:nucleolar protein 15
VFNAILLLWRISFELMSHERKVKLGKRKKASRSKVKPLKTIKKTQIPKSPPLQFSETQNTGDNPVHNLDSNDDEESEVTLSISEETQDEDKTKQEKNMDESSVDEFASGKSEILLEKDKPHKETRQKTEERGVIYLGHIPYGFFEPQMRAFFSQFGKVTRLRLSRNKKTGRSKHYCFIEFEDRDVARIAAEAMNGYMMFGKRLVAKLLEPEEVHPLTFRGANKRFVPTPTRRIAIQKINREKTEDEYQKNVKRLLKKERKKRQRLKHLGIDYDFPGFVCFLISLYLVLSVQLLRNDEYMLFSTKTME